MRLSSKSSSITISTTSPQPELASSILRRAALSISLAQALKASHTKTSLPDSPLATLGNPSNNASNSSDSSPLFGQIPIKTNLYKSPIKIMQNAMSSPSICLSISASECAPNTAYLA